MRPEQKMVADDNFKGLFESADTRVTAKAPQPKPSFFDNSSGDPMVATMTRPRMQPPPAPQPSNSSGDPFLALFAQPSGRSGPTPRAAPMRPQGYAAMPAPALAPSSGGQPFNDFFDQPGPAPIPPRGNPRSSGSKQHVLSEVASVLDMF